MTEKQIIKMTNELARRENASRETARREIAKEGW